VLVRFLETAVASTDGVVRPQITAVPVAILRLELARVVVQPRQPRLRLRRFRLMVLVELLRVLGVFLETVVRNTGGVGLRLGIVGRGARVRLVLVIRV
jgi:hypothetical protein